MIPPGFCGPVLRMCLFTMLIPVTITRLSFGMTRRTVPLLPRSLPFVTRTVSSLWMRCILQHLRRQGDDLHEVALPKLAGNRPEDARALGVGRVGQDHRGVVIEPDVGAVVPAVWLGHPHDDRADDLAFLDGAAGRGLLHCGDDYVAHASVAAPRAAQHLDHHHLARAGVVRDPQPGVGLDQEDSSSLASASGSGSAASSGSVSTAASGSASASTSAAASASGSAVVSGSGSTAATGSASASASAAASASGSAVVSGSGSAAASGSA